MALPVWIGRQDSAQDEGKQENIPMAMNYRQWEATQPFSPASPEAEYAEAAWTAAVEECRRLIMSARPTESTSAGLAMMLDEELAGML